MQRNGHAHKRKQACVIPCGVLALLGLAFALMSGAGHSQEQIPVPGGVVTLKITGPLPADVRAALAELIEPESVSQVIDTVSIFGTPVEHLCALPQISCPADRSQVVARAQLASLAAPDVAGIAPPTLLATRNIEIHPGLHSEAPSAPFYVQTPESYAVFGKQSSIRLAGVPWADFTIAVPMDRLKDHYLPISNEKLVIPPGASEAAVSLIERDLVIGGTSERQHRISRLRTSAQVDALLKRLKHANLAVDSGLPREGFSFIHFQTSGADCSANTANWPFDVEHVVKVMKFNEKVRERLRIPPPRRSRILIVDSGLGKALTQTEKFNPVLFAEPAEMITAMLAKRSFAGEPTCVDANGNGYLTDVYGAAAGFTTTKTTLCHDHLTMLEPFPQDKLSSQIYNPDHGSFVGTLAAGGPKFITAFPHVSKFVGLSFFRVTRRSLHDSLNVENAHNDVKESLIYANVIGADVINMSLKTDDDTIFGKFLENQTSLLVAAAGNHKENLDRGAPENRPASLASRPAFADNMIVVAALQPGDVAQPLWPHSARSPANVHIAAPGALISSFNAAGGDVCDSGTSAAAPLVSFTAAMLRALTGVPRQIVRARLLAAADHDPLLDDAVEDGRRLNIEAALDVFVDRVDTTTGLKRGWVEPAATGLLTTVCRSPDGRLRDFRGKIDLSLLWGWRKRPDGRASTRHQIELLQFTKEDCDVPDGAFSFFDLETGNNVEIQWSAVKKLLPTPFRAVKAVILNSNRFGEQRTVH